MRAGALLLAIVLASPSIFAQDPAKKDEAIKHFEVGLELVKQEAWDAALAEFLESRALYPTKNALKNAAICLRELKRWDEALDMYDELTARFDKELSTDDRKAVQDDVAKLSKFVGALDLKLEVPGGSIELVGGGPALGQRRTLCRSSVPRCVGACGSVEPW